jgi:uncharacterized damage-inducible protein DinB
MRRYLIATFEFNDRANRQTLAKVREIPDPVECVRLFSHLVNSQDKWLARIAEYPRDPRRSWWEPVYALEALEREWSRSVGAWIDFVAGKAEPELQADAPFVGFDGGRWAAPLQDIALQLNYHSIHHRAQMQWLIRAQGIEPEFVDYIGGVYRKID